MIRAKTLFILGAGASKPYGLPLGAELRRNICHVIDGNDQVDQQILLNGDYTEQDIRTFKRAFLRSGIRSIDEFLGRLPQFEGIGKMLIAGHISRFESPNDIISEATQDSWYRLLGNAMIDDTTNAEDIRQNKVKFITFNYDRSLEMYLHEAIKNAYQVSSEVAYRHWSAFGLMHMYGSLGSLNPNAADYRPYQHDLKPPRLDAAAAGIHIMAEQRHDGEKFGEARDWFHWAERVYFLGFGFDRINCERLGFDAVLDEKQRHNEQFPSIRTSTFQLTPAEIARAETTLFGPRRLWSTFSMQNSMTLRASGFPE